MKKLLYLVVVLAMVCCMLLSCALPAAAADDTKYYYKVKVTTKVAGDALVKETQFYYSLHSYLSNGQSEPMRALDEAGNPSSINAACVVMQPGVAQQTDELVFYFDKPVIGIRLLQEPFYSSEIIAFADDYYLELEIADQQPGIENAMMVEEMNFLEGFRDGGAMILSPDTMEAVFTSTHNAPPVISGIEDGGQYFTTQKVTVKDKDLESVTLNGEAVAFSGDSAVVTLSGDEDKEYTIFAKDKNGSELWMTIQMMSLDGFLYPIAGITPEDVLPEHEFNIRMSMEVLDAFQPGEHATAAEKEKLHAIEKAHEALLARIEEAETLRNSQSVQETMGITAQNVKPADKAALEQAAADLEKALADYSGNYDVDILMAIEEDLLRINGALDALAAMRANVPKTGDDSQIALWVLMLVMSTAGASALAFLGRKKQAE